MARNNGWQKRKAGTLEKKKNHSNGDGEGKVVDFVYVESSSNYSQEEVYHGNFSKEFENSYEKIGQKEFPILFRVLFLVFSAFCLMLTALVFLLLSIFFFINLVTLFKMEHFWNATKVLWLATKRLFVATFGLLIAVFNPVFGCCIITMYLLLTRGPGEDDWALRLMREHF